MVEVREQNENPQNKRRKRWSKVWEDFTMSTDGKGKAVCNHCKKQFNGSSKKGTTHLRNHSERCLRKRNNGGGGADGVVTKEISVIDLIKRSFDANGNTTKDWDPKVLNSRKGEVLKFYEEEKEKPRRFLNNLSCRFSLTIEKFNDRYSALTVNYIDDSWEMKTKIISFLKYTFNDEICRKQIEGALVDWDIPMNGCFMFSDHDGMLNNWVHKQASLPFVGLLFNVNNFQQFICDTFEGSPATICINRCLDHIHKSPSNEYMFKSTVANKAKSMGKKVNSERVPKKVNYFEELEIALVFKEAFCELEQIDPDFKSINLTKEQWSEATVICQQFRALHDIARTCPGRNHTTLNAYFPIFCDIFTKLLQLQRSERAFSDSKEASHSLRNKFLMDYWSRSNLILAIAVILDPRFKLDVVEKWYKEIYAGKLMVNLRISRVILAKFSMNM